MVDLRWLAPLPVADIIREASATGRVLVVDETRRSGGVGEGVIAALVDAGYVGCRAAGGRELTRSSHSVRRRVRFWSPRKPSPQGARTLLAR